MPRRPHLTGTAQVATVDVNDGLLGALFDTYGDVVYADSGRLKKSSRQALLGSGLHWREQFVQRAVVADVKRHRDIVNPPPLAILYKHHQGGNARIDQRVTVSLYPELVVRHLQAKQIPRGNGWPNQGWGGGGRRR